MKLNPPDELIRFLKSYKQFFILGHSEPDGDCLGSQLGVARLLKEMGAKVRLFSPGPFRRPEIQEYEELFETRIPAAVLTKARKAGGTAFIIVDCSTLDRIGPDFKEVLMGGGVPGEPVLPVAVIDHHASGEDFGTVRWIVPKAPAVAIMIHALFRSLEVPIDKDTAEYLFLGLSTDTGYFRHLQNDTAYAFDVAAELVRSGVNPNEIFFKMNGNRSLASRILLGRALARTQVHCGGRVLITWETLEEKKEFGPESRDSDTLYLNLQTVKKCQVVILIREESENERSVGLRSNHKIDVGDMAARRGGGGHTKASGYSTVQTREEIINDLLGELKKVFS